MEYRYPHFERQFLLDDRAFAGGPGPGQPMPDFDLPTTDGGRLRKADFVGQRPLLLVFGSITWPMTASAVPALKQLDAEFGDRVAFAILYVREAHPGERYPQPQRFDQKLEHARAFKDREHLPWPVAVDDIEGSLHRALDAKPNAFYLMDKDGNVAFRSLWSNDERTVRHALEAMVSGQPLPIGEDQSKIVPMLKGMGMMEEVLSQAGQEAKQDVLRQAPPMYGMARLAALFRPLPPLGRGIAAMATSMAGLLAVFGALRRLRSGRSSRARRIRRALTPS